MFFLMFFFVCSKLMKRRHNVFPLSRKRHNRYKITKQLKTGSPVPTFSEFRFSTNMDSRIPSKNHYWSLPTARGRSHPGWRSWATLPSLRTTGYVLSWEITVFYLYLGLLVLRIDVFTQNDVRIDIFTQKASEHVMETSERPKHTQIWVNKIK